MPVLLVPEIVPELTTVPPQVKNTPELHRRKDSLVYAIKGEETAYKLYTDLAAP
ncbi:MAG: hypothetical protein WC959_05070 [Kiritimatiellales bacterium]